ncbi:MAG: polysaccharide pyruvyl transferase CsaB [Niameybacter sp.]|uniref:polysaccharide pyruvyl transferase CsaB n=1 Tax=Niameybacter sp. TaxID=2033640 RepID=UPI002FC80A02
MGSKKSVVLSGYYGFNNIGDEAVLSSIITALRKHIPNVEITVLSNAPSQTKALYGVEAINRWGIKEIREAIKKSDLVISGGGSLLQDVTSSKVIPYYLGIVKIAQFYKKPVVFYSQGVGPVAKGLGKILIKQICNKVTHIFVREIGSKQLLESLGVTQTPITVAIDPVLGIEPKAELVADVKARLPEGKKVGLYIRPWKHDEEMIQKIAQLAQHIESCGYALYFIPMYHKEDLAIAKAIASRVKGEVHVIEQEMTIDEVVAYTVQFDFIVGMRLHSLIMAHAVEVPMIGLSYDPKVAGFLKEVHAPYCMSVDAIDEVVMRGYVDDLVKQLEQERKRIHLVNQDKKQKVELPAACIRELLG